MDTLLWILAATIIDGLIAFSGVLTLGLKKKMFESLIFALVAFSAGALLAGGLFHLFLESLEYIKAQTAVLMLLVGFIFFFLMERVLRWHHCHEKHCKVHPVNSLILLGDGLHNFIDGLVMAASFIIGVPFGIITSLMMYAHEIPQELGNFAVLVHNKMMKGKALWFNFLVQLTCVLGGIVGYLFRQLDQFRNLLMPFAAGGFLYIASSDLIPELHKEARLKVSIKAFLFFLVGIGFMIAVKFLMEG